MMVADMGDAADKGFQRFPLSEDEHRALLERARREVPAMSATAPTPYRPAASTARSVSAA
jgi:hypothetical protein